MKRSSRSSAAIKMQKTHRKRQSCVFLNHAASGVQSWLGPLAVPGAAPRQRCHPRPPFPIATDSSLQPGSEWPSSASSLPARPARPSTALPGQRPSRQTRRTAWLRAAAAGTVPSHWLDSRPDAVLKPLCQRRGFLFYPHLTDKETEAREPRDIPEVRRPELEHTSHQAAMLPPRHKTVPAGPQGSI